MGRRRDQFPPCTQRCEHEAEWLHWVKKGSLREVSEPRLFLAAHSTNVTQIKSRCECPPRFPFLSRKDQIFAFSQSRRLVILLYSKQPVIRYPFLSRMMTYIRRGGDNAFSMNLRENTNEADTEVKSDSPQECIVKRFLTKPLWFASSQS